MKALGLAFVFAIAAPAGAEAQSSFAGPYVGGYVGASPTGNDGAYQGGALAGYRLSIGEVFLLGLETQGGVGRYSGVQFLEGHVFGHAGLEIGGNTELFTALGAGLRDHNDDFGRATDRLWSFGGGAEIAVNDIIHVRGEVHSLFVYDGYSANSWATRANLSLIGQFK